MADTASKILRAHHYRWDSVELKEYKSEGSHFKDITRQTLCGEGPGEETLRHLTRYFEIQPGGYSTLERHEHTHTVIILRGAGELILDRNVETVALHDCIYIAPGTFHQFHATTHEPLGFLCIVDRERDRPQLPEKEDLEGLKQEPAVKQRLRV